MKSDLKLDWASHEAAKYANDKWHYSETMPMGKLIKIGVWEKGVYIGCVMYGRGATPNLSKPYNLKQTECVELVRIALNKHISPVSRIMSLSMMFLQRKCEGLKLIVSFADPDQGHHGGIYQATNWIYSGKSPNSKFYLIHGKKTHPRSLGAAGITQNITGARTLDKNATVIDCAGKYRYLMPLDKLMRKQIEPLAKPYPKRGLIEEQRVPPVDGGASPTSTLQIQKSCSTL